MAVLPSEFADLEKLLQDMPLAKKDGSPGLLAQGLMETETKKIPDYTEHIKKIEDSSLLCGMYTITSLCDFSYIFPLQLYSVIIPSGLVLIY